MTTLEALPATMRRAADRLDALRRAATPGDWRAVITDTEYCDGIATVCTAPGHPADEPWGIYDCCPDRPEGPALIKAADADLIVALRPVAAPLAAWLRVAADVLHWNIGFVEPPAWTSEAIDLARAVLGETGDDHA